MIPLYAEGGHYTGSSGSSYSKMIWKRDKKEKGKQKTNTGDSPMLSTWKADEAE